MRIISNSSSSGSETVTGLICRGFIFGILCKNPQIIIHLQLAYGLLRGDKWKEQNVTELLKGAVIIYSSPQNHGDRKLQRFH